MSFSLYPMLYRHLISHTDPEWAHHAGISLLSLAGKCVVSRRLLQATAGHLKRKMPVEKNRVTQYRPVTFGDRPVWGVMGLAAGMDKDARAIEGIAALGFGFIEIGTVTPLGQPGNEQPRLWRLIEEEGLRNRMGFNNEGVQATVQRLRELRSTASGRSVIVGANIGKNKVTPEAEAATDYYICARELAPWVDFVVVNVSSPNTPGLRDLQSVESLRPILEAARRGCEEALDRRMPLFVKIAPDLADDDIVKIVELTKELGLEGIVATNTTIAHNLGEGGVSGRPLFNRALDVVSLIATHLDPEQTLIAAGGITTKAEADAMRKAGADLLEGLSAFVHQGPCWPGRINRRLRPAVPQPDVEED